ncbi:MAG: hypothetical protein ACKODZ_03965, partial [Verrucomicrobiota bacterium]
MPNSNDRYGRLPSAVLGRVGYASVPFLWACLLSISGAVESGQKGIDATDRIPWQLPTENRYLFENQPKKFYQPTISRRLISGMFGFTRTSAPEPAR